MKYYIFKVEDTLGQTYYILNNQFVGYVGFDANELRSITEHSQDVERKYQLFAQSDYLADWSGHDRKLHEMNCDSKRFDENSVTELMLDHPVFSLSRDLTWYEVYFPSKNSSRSYLKEIGGTKTIQ